MPPPFLCVDGGKEADAPVLGSEPVIPAGEAQGIPTLKMPMAKGWDESQKPLNPEMVAKAIAADYALGGLLASVLVQKIAF